MTDQSNASETLIENLGWKSYFKTNLVKNLLSVSGATILSRLIGIIALGYPARILGPEKFGIVAFASSAIAYASILLSPGLLTWGARGLAKDRTTAARSLSDINALQLILATIAYSSLLVYALVGVKDPTTQQYILIAGLTLFSVGLSVDWVFNGLELTRIPAGLNVINSALYVSGLFLLLRGPGDIFALAWLPVLIGFPLVVAGYLILSRHGIRPHIPRMAGIRTAFVGAIPLGITSALVIVLHYANNFIVNAVLGTAALGIFSAGFRLVELVNTVPSMLASVFSPRLSRLSEEAPAQSRREATAFVGIHAALAAAATAFFLAEGPAIGATLYGSKFASVGALIQLFSIAIAANFAVCAYTACLISFGLDKVMIRVTAVSTVVSVGAGLALVPAFGLWGAAITIGLIDFAGVLVAIGPFRQHFGTALPVPWLRASGVGALLVGVAFGLQWTIPSFWIRLPIECLAAILVIISQLRVYLR